MTCKQCQHANRQANPAMTAQGFVRCNVHEKWEFFPPSHSCEKFKHREKK
jgi:hypothetical protein